MVAFAVGGLLGDTIFHLLPEIFLGEDSPEHVRFVLVEPNRNLVLGVAILIGFVTFVAMDKGLRIATGGGGGHSHSHSDSSHQMTDETITSGAEKKESNGEIRLRKKESKKDGSSSSLNEVEKEPEKEANASVKLGAYLNLMWVALEKILRITPLF